MNTSEDKSNTKTASASYQEHLRTCHSIQAQTQRLHASLQQDGKAIPPSLEPTMMALDRYTHWVEGSEGIITQAFQSLAGSSVEDQAAQPIEQSAR